MNEAIVFLKHLLEALNLISMIEARIISLVIPCFVPLVAVVFFALAVSISRKRLTAR